jgi:glycosyltransferase involved in cell wall biosynthesis
MLVNVTESLHAHTGPIDVSVIVPAHNAQATIARALAAVAGQKFSGRHELIVVDDGSTDATAQLAEHAGAQVIRHPEPRGPAAARNTGRAAAQGALLAYTDSDCEPTPEWLARGWAAAQDAELVQGSVRPAPRAKVGPFDRTLRVSESSPRLFESANLFVRPELFDRLGGFRAFAQRRGGGPFAPADPPGLRPSHPTEHFGEDILFGYAAARLGARVRFHPEAEVHHAVFSRGPRGYIRERWRLRWMPTLVREVPELRGNFVRGVFLSGRSARFDLAAAAVIGATASRRRWPLLCTVPYLATLPRRQLWRRSAWRENLARCSADAVTCAALLRGTAAARRIVL